MLLYNVLRGRIFKARAKQDILKGEGGVEVCSPKKLLMLHTYPAVADLEILSWGGQILIYCLNVVLLCY